jgi:hypothetical protein
MGKSFTERLKAYPELEEHMEAMLDVVENIGGRADGADDAERQVIAHMRNIGAAALGKWAVEREKKATANWTEGHPTSIKHGKKKFIGEQPSDNEKS